MRFNSSAFSSAWSFVTPALLVLALAGVYANSFRGPFVLDDWPNIVENADVRSIATSWRSAFDRSRRDITLAGRPVAAVTFALNWAISGQQIWSYRLVNVLIHVAATLVLFGIVRRTLLFPDVRERFAGALSPSNASGLAFAVALVWAVHPLHVTSVTYVVQRVESLGGLMILLTLYGFIRASTGGSKLWFGLAILACAIGMGVKETVAVAPLLVLIYDRMFLAGSVAAALRKHPFVYSALAGTWLILGAILITSPRAGLLTGADWDARIEYLRTQGWAILHYLRLSIVPIGTVLDYGGSEVGRMPGWRAIEWVPGAIIGGLLIVVTIVALVRGWPVGFAAAVFVLVLAPSSSVIPISMEGAAEHRMYLPLAAVVSVIVLGIARVLRSARGIAIVTGGAALVALVFGVLTVQRNALFHDELKLWSADVRRQPDNARSRTALGVALFDRREFEDAIAQYGRAIHIKPTYAEAWHNLGDALLRTRRPADAEEAYRRALALPPPSFKTHYNYAQLLMTQRRFAEAAEQFQRAVEMNDRDPRLWNALGFALANAGELERAVESFRRALEIEPGFTDAKTNLDHVLRMLPAK